MNSARFLLVITLTGVCFYSSFSHANESTPYCIAEEKSPAAGLVSDSAHSIAEVAKTAAPAAQSQEADIFDSFFFGTMSRVPTNTAQGRKEFQLKFQNANAQGLTVDQIGSAWALLNKIRPGVMGAGGSTMTPEQIYTEVQKWSADPKNTRGTQLFFLSMYGSVLSNLYDLSGKTAKTEDILKFGGGQCTEIHEVIAKIGEHLAALGLKPVTFSGVLWGKGNEGGLHGVTLFQDTKTGKFLLQNYSQVMEMDARSVAEASEMALAYLGPFTNSVLIGGGERPRLFLPRTAAWYGTSMRKGITQPSQTIEARVATGSGNEYEITVKPGGGLILGTAKAGDYEIIYAGLGGSSTYASRDQKFQLRTQYFAGYTKTTAPYLSFNAADKNETSQSRDGLSFSGQLDAIQKIQEGPRYGLQAEAGTFSQMIGWRKENMPSPFHEYYIGVSQRFSTPDRERETRLGAYRVFNTSRTTEGHRQGDGRPDYDFRDVFKFETRHGQLDGNYRRLYGQVVIPSGGAAHGVQVGGEVKRGNVTLSGEAARFFSTNELFYQDRDWALNAAAKYETHARGDKDLKFATGIAYSTGDPHPHFRGRDSDVPGFSGQRGARLFASVNAKLGNKIKDNGLHNISTSTVEGDETEVFRQNGDVRVPVSREWTGKDGRAMKIKFDENGKPSNIEVKNGKSRWEKYEFKDGKLVSKKELDVASLPRRVPELEK